MVKTQNREIELLNNPPTPKIVQRADKGYKLNYGLSSRISDQLNKIKGRIDSEIGETGDLEINEYIDFKIKQITGIADHFNIFEEVHEQNGLDVRFLIDCSGSMSYLGQKMADITATIMHAMKKCPFIDFKTIGFSAPSDSYQGVNDYINDYTEAGRIHADPYDYHDIQSLCIDQARKELSDSENKKLIILLTDGYPYCGDRSIQPYLQGLFEKSVTKCENEKIEVFCIYYGDMGSHGKQMQNIFGNNIYQSEDFSDISEQLVEKLKKSVENLNSGASN